MTRKIRKNVIWTSRSEYFLPDLVDQREVIEYNFGEDVYTWDKDDVEEAYNDSEEYEDLLVQNNTELEDLLDEIEDVTLPGNILAILPVTENGYTYYYAHNLGTNLANIFDVGDCHELEYPPYGDELLWYGYRKNIHCDLETAKHGDITIIYKVLKPNLSDVKQNEFAQLLRTRSPENNLTSEEWAKYTDTIGKHLSEKEYNWLTTTYDRF